ncbi:hypothetical protein HMN09_01077600 [Mycena chlorophos]|uniref:Peptidase A1 domain-containing protein n=1 Tax=Mycena chlorophos TaxID=658473 RepID=A0A8H6W046_MYCCL|nr:hypothetical protein HMN09_01077600 [Mycena chlorophos]
MRLLLVTSLLLSSRVYLGPHHLCRRCWPSGVPLVLSSRTPTRPPSSSSYTDAMSDPVTVVVGDVNFLSHSLEQSEPGGWYPSSTNGFASWYPSRFNDSMFVPDPSPLRKGIGWVLQFHGLSISLFGVTPPNLPAYNQTIAISNPISPASNGSLLSTYTSYEYPSPAFGGQILTTGRALAGRFMQLGLSGFRGLALDYALIEVGNDTNLVGHTILVDETSEEIAWTAGWSKKGAKAYGSALQVQCQLPALPYNASDLSLTNFVATMTPHGNTTHVSANVGDKMGFSFAGSSISLYGVTPGPASDQSWQLTMRFSIDGTHNTTTTFTASSLPSPPVVAPHFLYFTAPEGALDAGNHTLIASITEVVNSASTKPQAQIDYLVYAPTFATVKDKPSFDLPDVHSGNGNGTSQSAGGGVNKGAIAGGIVTGVVLLVLLVFGALWLRRRQRRRLVEAPMEPYNLTDERFLVQPYPSVHATDPGSGDMASRSCASMKSKFGPSSGTGPSKPSSSSNAPMPMVIPSQKSRLYRAKRQSPPAPAKKQSLAEEIDWLHRHAVNIQSSSPAASASVLEPNTALEARMQELQNQMVLLTEEMRSQEMNLVPPPQYDSLELRTPK